MPVISKKPFFLFLKDAKISFGIFILGILIGCRSETLSSSEIGTTELTEFETFITVGENRLAVPSILRYNGSSLFVYDGGHGKILELNDRGEIIHEYGQKGQGPGEFASLNNIFITDKHLHAVDNLKFYIYTFDRTGELTSSLDYGEPVGAPPPVPMAPGKIIVPNPDNKPAVTLSNDVMFPSHQSDSTLYELSDRNGSHLSDIGKIPEGSTYNLDYNKMKEDVENRVVPSYYRPSAFPVTDQSNSEEIFLIYSAIPKIAKYEMNGQLLWERTIPPVAEVDSVTNRFYETMERLQQADLRNRIDLQYYSSGRSSPSGELFLAMGTNPVLIHRFSNTGELTGRYKLISEGADLLPIFDIDFAGNRIYIVTEEAEIRTYSF